MGSHRHWQVLEVPLVIVVAVVSLWGECHYLFLVWLNVWNRSKRGNYVGRHFVAVTEGLGELCHNTETCISNILIKFRHLYLGFVGSQE